MIEQMAIAIDLLGFNDLARSVGPFFFFSETNFINNYRHIVQTRKKSQCGKLKKSRFLSTGHGILPSCGCKAHETMVAKCKLVL